MESFPGARSLVPCVGRGIGEKYREKMKLYRRVVADTHITCDGTSHFMFEARCKTCGNLHYQPLLRHNEVAERQRELFRLDKRYEVKEFKETVLRFHASTSSQSGLYRWGFLLIATAPFSKLVTAVTGVDLHSVDCHVELVWM